MRDLYKEIHMYINITDKYKAVAIVTPFPAKFSFVRFCLPLGIFT